MGKKNIIQLILISILIIVPLLLILGSFWGIIFDAEGVSFESKITVFIPFCFVAWDLIRLRFFSRRKKGFSYLLISSIFTFIIYWITLPVSSVFSFNGLEYEQNHGLVSAVIFLLANVFFSDFLGLSEVGNEEDVNYADMIS